MMIKIVYIFLIELLMLIIVRTITASGNALIKGRALAASPSGNSHHGLEK
jgi:hypothetical protein